MRIAFTIICSIASCCLLLQADQTNSTGAVEESYLRTVTQRAERIAKPLGIADAAKADRVVGIMVQQYCDLAKIHDERDAGIAAAKKAENNAEKDQLTAQTRKVAEVRLDQLHAQFLQKLSAELSPEQVDQVKDGMTYGVLHVTYAAYLKSFPNLAEEQKQQIKAWLTEAREIAMDQGSSREKHAVFGKYKGRINNYLVKAGYDLKEGEANLRKSMSNPTTSQPK